MEKLIKSLLHLQEGTTLAMIEKQGLLPEIGKDKETATAVPKSVEY